MTVTEFINSPTKTNSNKNIFFVDAAAKQHVVTPSSKSGNKSRRNLLMKNASISLQEFYFKKGQLDEDEKKGLVTTTTTTATKTAKAYKIGGKKQLEPHSHPTFQSHYRRSLSNDDKNVSNKYNHQLSTLEACCNLLACCFLWCV